MQGRGDFVNINIEKLTPLVRKAVQLIKKDYLSYRKVQEIAKELNIAEATLCREFKRQSGVSCKKLLLFLKISQAIELFHDPELSLNEIADKSGFSNPKRFSEIFHKMTNFTPREYRKKITWQNEKEILQEIWRKIKKTEEISKKRK